MSHAVLCLVMQSSAIDPFVKCPIISVCLRPDIDRACFFHHGKRVNKSVWRPMCKK